MSSEVKLLTALRPYVAEPTPETRARAREILLSRISADARGRRPRWLRGRSARRWVVPCIAVVCLGAAGVGVAGSLQDWWKSAEPAVRPDDIEKLLDLGPAAGAGRSEPIIERARTVARAPGMALVAAPTKQGGYCLVPVPDEGRLAYTCVPGERSGGQTSTWVDNHGAGPAWYLGGRVLAAGAARIELFSRITHPLDEFGPEKLPGTPLEADIGPGGFFIARIPRELWPDLELAYGQFTVLDAGGSVLKQSCRFLGATPVSPFYRTTELEAFVQLGFRSAVAGPVHTLSCPATGVAVDRSRMALSPPRDEDITGLVGRDVLTGKKIEIASYLGRPLLVAAWDPGRETSWRFLETLDAFARRHPHVPIISIVRFPSMGAADGLRLNASQTPGLRFPAVEIEDLWKTKAIYWDAHERFGLAVLALDAKGRIAAELATPQAPSHPWDYGLLTQQALEDALAAAAAG
jgi:hypothetical protein